MKKVFVTIACFALGGMRSEARTEEWTQFRGRDFMRTSVENIAPQWDSEGIAWKTPLPGRGASSPVVFKDRIYLTAFTGYAIDGREPGDPSKLVRHLLCFDVNTGEQLWQKSAPDSSAKDPFSTWGTAKAGYASSTAAVDESGVYVLFGATGVLAFSHDGEERWRTFCGDEIHEYPAGTSPILYDDLVIVNASYECGDLIALKKHDGTEAWRQKGVTQSWNTPVVYRSLSGEDELAVSALGEIRALDPKSGTQRWSCAGIDEYVCPSLTVEDGILYAIGGRKGTAIAVRSGGRGDVTESHRLWTIGKGSNVSSPVYHDGHLYWAKDKSGIVYCVNARTGEVVYEHRLQPSAKEIYATPLLADGRLYYVSRENGIFVVAAKPDFALLAHTRLEGDESPFAASPVPLAGGAVLLRSDRFLYRMKPASTAFSTHSGAVGRQAAPAFEPTWESLQQYQCPDWFRDAKFGIYAHWGPYCVPAYPTTTDWYSHHMYQPGHPIHKYHVETYGPVTEFGYKELVPLFTAPQFDADEWADLYKESGARFAGPVAEHSDGFALWDSDLTQWDSVDKGPKRDVVGELQKAIRSRGLKFITSFHHHWKWGWYATPVEGADCLDPQYEDLYGPRLPQTAWGTKDENGRLDYMDLTPLPDKAFNDQWLGKIKEVVDNYHPDLIWFDNRMHIIDDTHRLDMTAHYYNQAAGRRQEVVLTYKNKDIADGVGVIDLERSRMPDIYPDPWLTDTSIARNSWSYCPRLDYYSAERLIHDLIDIVSKNGCMLLNIAPHPDGSIPEPQKQRLRAMGAWLHANGEAIYGTRPWKVFGEGPTQMPKGHLSDLRFDGFSAADIRFTQAKDGSALYAFLFGLPDDGSLLIRSLTPGRGAVKSVGFLATQTPIDWQQTSAGLQLRLSAKSTMQPAIVLRITGDGLTVSR
jgi:alpha-L-fucosidase